MDSEIKAVVDQIRKEFGGGSVFSLGTDPQIIDEQRERLSSGLYELDWCMGGGLVRGVMHEIYGPEASSKTTLALQIIKQCQKNGGKAFYCDAEHSLDITYAKKIGVDTENLLISQPDYGEQGLDIVQTVAESGVFDIIVIDSVTGLVPKSEIDGDFTDANMGAHPRLMSKMCRVLTPIINKQNIYFVVVNQVRQKIGVFFGSPETTTGGNGIKYYAGMRIRVSSTKESDNDNGVRLIKADFKKQKWGTPYRNSIMRLVLGEGFDVGYDRLMYGLRCSFIERNSSTYKLDGEWLGNGKVQAAKTLSENEDIIKRFNDHVIGKG